MDFIIGVDDPPPTYAQIIEDTEEQRQESDFISRKSYIPGFRIFKGSCCWWGTEKDFVESAWENFSLFKSNFPIIISQKSYDDS